MGLFSKSSKSKAPDCRACDGSGVVQTGTSKWTGAKFSKCSACNGTGTR